eukprot:6173880-Pleurochrysis_carterae.AAC.1
MRVGGGERLVTRGGDGDGGEDRRQNSGACAPRLCLQHAMCVRVSEWCRAVFDGARFGAFESGICASSVRRMPTPSRVRQRVWTAVGWPPPPSQTSSAFFNASSPSAYPAISWAIALPVAHACCSGSDAHDSSGTVHDSSGTAQDLSGTAAGASSARVPVSSPSVPDSPTVALVFFGGFAPMRTARI